MLESAILKWNCQNANHSCDLGQLNYIFQLHLRKIKFGSSVCLSLLNVFISNVMSVHYKFKSALEYDTVTFDGLHISVKDLKNAILQQKRFGRSTDFDLQVTNAQTKEVYEDENTLIPKNTSLLIARVPLANQAKSKPWEGYGGDSTPPTRLDEGPIAKAVDLANLDVPEDDKIKAMMSQSTQDYDPSNYLKIRGANQMGAVPPNYRCYKCHQSGHWIKDCLLGQGPEPIEIKKSTGIPRSFMVPVEGPQVPGAMITPNGQYAVPALDHQAYTQKQAPAAPIEEIKPEIPEDLVCSICSDLLTDAVMIPCCGNSFCDECIRSCLLESEEHECPDCHEREISPGTLIPNRYLRNSVSNFKNNTGYVKKHTRKPTPVIPEVKRVDALEVEKPKSAPGEDNAQAKPDPKEVTGTVISEADSTEPPKKAETTEDVDVNRGTKLMKQESVPEGPPGVSPRQSPKAQPITNMMNAPPRVHRDQGVRQAHKHPSHERSPLRRPHRTHRSPNYDHPRGRQEERPGTPTVDEPGTGGPPGYSQPGPYNTTVPPGVVPPVIGLPQASVLQGPPPYPPGQPPPGIYPPPNFRLPPPNAYMPPGPYSVPPRPVFDGSRPPVPTGPYTSYPPGPRPRGRDYLPPRGIRGRTPPRIIDDPLEAFNRMLREKDERERRAKQRKGRSYSRSSSRSLSRSPRRMRSRSPRRRSRSRSFSMSRSRSRSFSPSMRGSPSRDISPRNSPRRRAPSRYRSPIRSPPRYRYKDGPPPSDRGRDRDYDRDRDYNRDVEYGGRNKDFRERDDYSHYDNYDRDRGRNPKGQWGQGMPRGPPDGYYQPNMHQQMPPQYVPPNRYPPRDNYPPFMGKTEPIHPPVQHQPPPHQIPRRYEEVVPPGTEQPPVPGLEPSPNREERFPYKSPGREHKNEKDVDKKERRNRYSKSPEKAVSPVTGKKEVKERRERHESPDRHKKRRHGSSDKEEKHKKDNSDDEKSRKSKEKKKRKERKEAERKKRKEKKEKKEQEKKKVKEVKKKVVEEEEPEVEEKQEEVIEKEVEEEVKIVKKELKVVPEEIFHREADLSPKLEDSKPDLYADILTEGIDNKVVENYVKFSDENGVNEEDYNNKTDDMDSSKEEGEIGRDEDDEEKDVLELHSSEAEMIKAELEKSDILAPLPEKSKWELDEDTPLTPTESLVEIRCEKTGKVTNEVLKRAENAIFAKAINAIRPIEIKKISLDRAKLYSGERHKNDPYEVDNIQVTIPGSSEEEIFPSNESKMEVVTEKPPQRLSVKERLGVKVDDLDRIVKVDRPFDRNRSRSLSPLSKRASDLSRNYSQGERRVELDERKRHERNRKMDERHRNYRPGMERRDMRRDELYRRLDNYRDSRRNEAIRKPEDKRHHGREHDVKEKRKRTRSRSDSHDKKSEKDKKKRKDKKQRKEKEKRKHHKKEDEEKDKDTATKIEKVEQSTPKPKAATDRRKPTLDEANFEPDYDLESESDKEDDKKRASKSSDSDSDKNMKDGKKKVSSSSDSSTSSSEEDRKRKKHRKHKKKKSKRDSSSSSSDSDSDSSEDEKERKRRKHKKKQKKKKKSKHK